MSPRDARDAAPQTPYARDVTPSAAERYIRLGLQLGRHVDGIVDSYSGPPEPAAEVEAEPPVEPRRLVADAEALLDELEDGWLRDQVAALRTYAGVLAGESLSYADEVEGCYGVRPGTPTRRFSRPPRTARGAAARRRSAGGAVRALGALDPTCRPSRSSADRRGDRGGARVDARLVELPAGEGVVLEIVRDEPWWAYCEYLGDLRSRIAVNVDLPMSALDLLVLAIHETYPGHHAERCARTSCSCGAAGCSRSRS